MIINIIMIITILNIIINKKFKDNEKKIRFLFVKLYKRVIVVIK